MSLKWKLTAGLMCITLAFALIYLVLTKRTFEADKISFVLESQQRQVDSLAKDFENQIARMLFDARTVLAQRSMASVFWDNPQLLALEVSGRKEFRLEKTKGSLAEIAELNPVGQAAFKVLDEERFALAVTENGGERGEFVMRIIFETAASFDLRGRGQILALADGRGNLWRNVTESHLDSAIQNLAKENAAAAAERREIEGVGYLISRAKVHAAGGIHVIALFDEREALPPATLFAKRTVIFLIFCFFTAGAFSILAVNEINKCLRSQISAEEKAGEIESKLNHAAASARVDAEVRAAKLARETLFPAQSFYKNAHIRLQGQISADAAGAWWYYEQKDSELWIMIAHAYGEPLLAPLTFSAARTAVSLAVASGMDLKETARQLDRAVYASGSGRLSLDAFLLKLNVELGEGRFIQSGKAGAAIMRREGQAFRTETLAGNHNRSFGEMGGSWSESLLQLNPQDRLVAFAQESMLGNGRFVDLLLKTISADLSPDIFAAMMERHFHTAGGELNSLFIDYKV